MCKRHVTVNTSSSGIPHLQQASNLHANGCVLTGLCKERCGHCPHRATKSVPSAAFTASVGCFALQLCLKASCKLAHNDPTSCTQLSKRLVTYSSTSQPSSSLAPTGPQPEASCHSSIAEIAGAHFKRCLANVSILLDIDLKAYMGRKAGEFFPIQSLWLRCMRVI
jgi:hypothetical protein